MVVVQPQPPDDTDSQLEEAGLVRRTQPKRGLGSGSSNGKLSLEETVQRIAAGELGKSEAYR